MKKTEDLIAFIESLDKDELEKYHRRWIVKIGQRHTPERITKHLKKHLEEKIENFEDWITSTDNLLEIYCATDETRQDIEIIQKYYNIIRDYKKIKNIPIKNKLLRLVRHYKRYPDTATPPPSKTKAEIT